MSELRTHPADLNLSPEVVGHQRFLFVCLSPSGADGTLADALDGLGKGMENMHDVAGYPSEDACQRGRFQFLRAEPTLSGAFSSCEQSPPSARHGISPIQPL